MESTPPEQVCLFILSVPPLACEHVLILGISEPRVGPIERRRLQFDNSTSTPEVVVSSPTTESSQDSALLSAAITVYAEVGRSSSSTPSGVSVLASPDAEPLVPLPLPLSLLPLPLPTPAPLPLPLPVPGTATSHAVPDSSTNDSKSTAPTPGGGIGGLQPIPWFNASRGIIPPSLTSEVQSLVDDIVTLVTGLVPTPTEVWKPPPNTKNWFFNTTGLPGITDVLPLPTLGFDLGLNLAGECQAKSDDGTVTSISIIHTSTITWTGNPIDYTPPFPLIATPCTSIESEVTMSGGRRPAPTFTDVYGSVPAGTTYVHARPTVVFWTTDKNPAVVFPTTPGPDYGMGNEQSRHIEHQTAALGGGRPAGGSSSGDGSGSGGGGGGGGGGNNSNTDSGSGNDGDNGDDVDGDTGGFTPPSYEKGTSAPPSPVLGTLQPDRAPAPTPPPPYRPGTGANPSPTSVTVVIRTTQVIINGQTFVDNPNSKTSTAVVGTDTFVINPTQVIGAGATVRRPFTGGVFMPVPMTTTVEGMEVIYGPSTARIDNTVFTIGPTQTTAVVRGQQIMVGPEGISFPNHAIPIAAPAGATQMAVMGGELITAIGQSVVVIQGTSFTYGPSTSPMTKVEGNTAAAGGPSGVIVSGTTTKVVGESIVTIGPQGVIVDGSTTIGGPSAEAGSTTFKIIGGATVTEMGSTAVVVHGTTYTVGPNAPLTTMVVAGQTLTIGPGGVAASTLTFAQPYATTTVLVPKETASPGDTPALSAPTNEPKNTGIRSGPAWGLWIIASCLATGAGFGGQLFS